MFEAISDSDLVHLIYYISFSVAFYLSINENIIQKS